MQRNRHRQIGQRFSDAGPAFELRDPAVGEDVKEFAGEVQLFLADAIAGEMSCAAFAVGERVEDRIELEAGDVLCCYTDGVTECHAPDGSLFGRERLEAALAAAAPGGAAEVRAAVERELDAYRAGAERSDDVTLLVLEAGAEEGEKR